MIRSTLFSAVFLGAALAAAACTSSTDPNDGSSEDDLRASSACTNKACGDSCSLCAGRPNCFETAVLKFCSASKKCTSTQPVCGPSQDAGSAYNPCAAKSCGDSCHICPPNDPNCFETAVVKACDAQGECKSETPICNAADAGPYNPCAGKTCGTSCKICPPGDANCFETAEIKVCQVDGACNGQTPACN